MCFRTTYSKLPSTGSIRPNTRKHGTQVCAYSSFGYAFSLRRVRALLKRDEHYSMLYESSDIIRNLFGGFSVLICSEFPDNRKEIIE